MPVTSVGSGPVAQPQLGALEKAWNSGVVLKRGAQGPAVKALQEALNALGFECGAADGAFGPRTEAAVVAFQQAQGAAAVGAADGKAGPRTLRALLGGAATTTPATTTPQAPADSFEPGNTAPSTGKLRRMKDREVTPAITAKAKEIRDLYARMSNIGKEYPVEIDGKQYVARIEKHYHPPGGPLKPWGDHAGVSMFVVE